ncbi:MAG: hydrogenase expression/formation protein HypE [gamma proteobacterium symbiont of Taylorina sp.]|nr:hydrogenase expression/formation protein HypE [gamma proteobacterium symbiont of Taylorina sp.]
MNEKYISLAHGNGGRYMRELIEDLFAHHLSNPLLNTQNDAVNLSLDQTEIAFTTDGFTVNPLEFPGGTIGSLAIHGTVNDLAVAGAIPQYFSLNAFIEEGLPFEQLERIIISMAEAAKEAGVVIVTGDTKVLPRGECAGVFFATSGIGSKVKNMNLGMDQIKPGDKILVSGTVGDHGTAVMLAREQFGLKGDLQSDAASVLPLTKTLLQLDGLRFMRDPTRGGLASVCNEIARATQNEVQLLQTKIPIHEQVQSVCDILGYDPLYLACEGRVVAIIAAEQAAQALQLWQTLDTGQHAEIIGEIKTGHAQVILTTELGGKRFLEELEEDPLPRIC